MERLLTVSPLVDKQTIEIIAWVLGPYTASLWKRFLNGLSAGEKEKFILKKNIDLDDLEDIPESMTIILANASQKMVEAFVSDCLYSLRARKNALSYKGKSDIEKRIKTLSKMYSLSKNEISLVEFIYIITIWIQAEYYFVDFLKRHDFSGRRHLKTIMQKGASVIWRPEISGSSGTVLPSWIGKE